MAKTLLEAVPQPTSPDTGTNVGSDLPWWQATGTAVEIGLPALGPDMGLEEDDEFEDEDEVFGDDDEFEEGEDYEEEDEDFLEDEEEEVEGDAETDDEEADDDDDEEF